MTKVCSEEGCDKAMKGRGLCHTHYMRGYRSEAFPEGPLQCAECGETKLYGKGLCKKHYMREYRKAKAAGTFVPLRQGPIIITNADNFWDFVVEELGIAGKNARDKQIVPARKQHRRV